MSGSRKRVLVTDRFASDAMAKLTSDPALEVQTSASPEPSSDELRDCNALIIRSRTKVTASLLSQSPNLQLIVTATSGFDHIDFKETEAHKIAVAHTPEANAQSAAELTWALVLACARRIPEAHRAVKNGDWSREALNGTELNGKTYGIIGLGRIGSRVAAMARAFGMSVVAYDPYHEQEWFTQHGVTRLGLHEVVRLSDVLSLHVPATAETRHMINGIHFQSIPRGAILVNTSRGQAINEIEMIEALESGKLHAAGLDVYQQEPLPTTSKLMRLANVVLSPHLGATTTEAFHKASLEAAHKVSHFFATGELDDQLPPRAAWAVAPFIRQKSDS